jgi:hypothetical protein
MPDHKHLNVKLDAGMRLDEHVPVVKRTEDRFVGFVERSVKAYPSLERTWSMAECTLTLRVRRHRTKRTRCSSPVFSSRNSTRGCTPTASTEPADCEALDERVLRMQIVRPSLGSVWRDLNVDGGRGSRKRGL